MLPLRASCHKLKHFPLSMSAALHELGAGAQAEFIEVFHHTDLESAQLITQVGFRFIDQVAHQASRSLPFGPACYFYTHEEVALTEAMVNHMLDGVVIVARLGLAGLKRHALSEQEFTQLDPGQLNQMADANGIDVIDLRGLTQGRGIVVVRPQALDSLKITGVRTVPSYGREPAEVDGAVESGVQSSPMEAKTFVDDLLTRFRPAA